MKIIISTVATIFITLPILLYLLIFIGVKYWTKNGRKAMNIAINITTPLLIFSVHHLFITIWSYSFFSYIIMFMLLVAMIFTYIYWRMRGEIIYRKLFLGYWRLIFLLFLLIYLLLVMYGIFSRAIEAIISR